MLQPWLRVLLRHQNAGFAIMISSESPTCLSPRRYSPGLSFHQTVGIPSRSSPLLPGWPRKDRPCGMVSPWARHRTRQRGRMPSCSACVLSLSRSSPPPICQSRQFIADGNRPVHRANVVPLFLHCTANADPQGSSGQCRLMLGPATGTRRLDRDNQFNFFAAEVQRGQMVPRMPSRSQAVHLTVSPASPIPASSRYPCMGR